VVRTAVCSKPTPYGLNAAYFGQCHLGSPVREICTPGSAWGDESKRPCPLGEASARKRLRPQGSARANVIKTRLYHPTISQPLGGRLRRKLDHPLRSMPRQNASPRFHVTLSLARTQNPWIAFGEARSCPAALRGRIRVIHDVRRHGEDDLARLSPPRKRSEGETTTDCRSTVVVGVIGDAGFMRNGDGQTAAHPGIRNSGITVETLGEVMIQIERPLVEGARA